MEKKALGLSPKAETAAGVGGATEDPLPPKKDTEAAEKDLALERPAMGTKGSYSDP